MPRSPKSIILIMAKRAEPPKLILISACWVWTPMNNKITDRGMLRCLCCAKAYTNITAKTFIKPIFLVIQANCPDSQARNKAKNALSLATPVSLGMAVQK